MNMVAITLLVFAIYFPRHRRRDLAVAYLGVNVGVLAVANVLSTATIGIGLGLGLFGVLSIIRLRSFEITQHEIAYYFCALALGLLGGLSVVPLHVLGLLMALIVATMFVGDHPRLLSRYRHETIVLDRAYLDEQVLRQELRRLLGAEIHGLTVTKLDLVNDATWVDVRYSVSGHEPADGDAVPAEAAASAIPESVARDVGR